MLGRDRNGRFYNDEEDAHAHIDGDESVLSGTQGGDGNDRVIASTRIEEFRGREGREAIERRTGESRAPGDLRKAIGSNAPRSARRPGS